jgi:signal transduction histidine kinase
MDKARILIVDDELGPREALRMILKDDFNLAFATNGRLAVDHVLAKPVDLVVMDMKMPQMDGVEALKRMKAHDPLLPVIMVTGYGTIDTAVEAMKIGALDYITKPFDSFAILDKIRNAISQSRKDLDSHRMLEQIQETSSKLAEQQERLQKDILQLSKLSSIGMLAQGLAHNLSSPLLIILGRAELMKDKLIQMRSKLLGLSSDAGFIEKEETLALFREYDHNLRDTDIIIENVAKLTDIIRNIMQKSRQDQVQVQQLLSLSSVMREELKFLDADLFFKHNVEKHYDLAEDLPFITGVYSDFSQTFLNIIQNAIDAMHDSQRKELFVRTYAEQDRICVLIRDTGCGIPPQDLDRIFEPYFSTKKASPDSSRPMGTGLGLHMVTLLMEPYKAQIEVRSKPGNTSFLLKIPYQPSH